MPKIISIKSEKKLVNFLQKMGKHIYFYNKFPSRAEYENSEKVKCEIVLKDCGTYSHHSEGVCIFAKSDKLD